MKRFISVLAVIGLALSFGATSAGAVSTAPYTSGGISVSNNTPSAGESITVTVEGCQPNNGVTIALGSTEMATPTADANGTASADITVPASAAAGSTHTVTATCVSSSTGENMTQTATITIAGAGTSATTAPSASPTPAAGGSGTSGNTGTNGAQSGSTLPATGSKTGPLIALALVLVAVGFGAVFLARRRSSQA